LIIVVLGFQLHKAIQLHQPFSQPATKTTLPTIEISSDQNQLPLKPSSTAPVATQLLFNTLGHEQDWHFFYLPQPEHARQALMPQKIQFHFKPISAYQPSDNHRLYAPVVGEGITYSGFFCQPKENETILHCSLYISDEMFDRGLTENIDSFLHYQIFRTLIILTNQKLEDESTELKWNLFKKEVVDNKAQLFESSYQQSDLPNNHFLKLLNFFDSLTPQAHAQAGNWCDGFLECKVKVFYYLCPDGVTRCYPPGDRRPECGNLKCVETPHWSCTGPWEDVGPWYCRFESWPACNNPMGGTCEVQTAYCQTRGNCYPEDQSQPNPPPPPIEDPECPGTCCPDADGSCNEAITGTCPTGYTCCDYCATGGEASWPPYGTFHAWLFYDVNRNGEWDAGDQAMPAEITSEVTITATTTGGEGGSWSAGTVHTRDLTWPDWQRFENAGNYSACFKGSASSPFKSPLRRGRGLRGSGLEPA